MICNECGEQEAVFHGLCEDCRDLALDNDYRAFGPDYFESNVPEDTPSLCNCEDRPCCGCPVPK